MSRQGLHTNTGQIVTANQSNKTIRVIPKCLPVLFVWVEALRLSQQFSVMSGRSHCIMGITSTFGEVNVSCSRIQHGDPHEDRTPDLSLR